MTAEELSEADNGQPIIILNTGTLDDGTPYWAYVAIKPSRYREFMDASEKGKTLSLGNYGEIIQCGMEEKVPDNVKEEMKHLYGCDDNCMDKLTEDIRRARTEFLNQQQNKRIADVLAILKRKKEQD